MKLRKHAFAIIESDSHFKIFNSKILKSIIDQHLGVVADINGAGKLFPKVESDDTGIGLNIVRMGKIGVKGLFL